MPLNKSITRFAQTKLPAPVQFNLLGVTTGGVPLTDLHTQQDNFGIAQFEDLSDQDKLSQASFTKLDAGFSVGSGVARAANSTPGVLDYYTDYFEPAELTIYILPSFLQRALIGTAPSALAPSQSIGVRKYASAAECTARGCTERSLVLGGFDHRPVGTAARHGSSIEDAGLRRTQVIHCCES